MNKVNETQVKYLLLDYMVYVNIITPKDYLHWDELTLSYKASCITTALQKSGLI